MSKKLKAPEAIPQWLRLMSPDGKVCGKEVAALFGFASPSGITQGVRSGAFPPPDLEWRKGSGSGNPVRVFWFKKTLLAETARRKAINAEIDALEK